LVRIRLTSLAVVYLVSTVFAIAQQPSAKVSVKAHAATGTGGKIDFPTTLMEKIPSSLPIVKLTAQAPPEAFLQETLGKIGIQKEAIQPLLRTPGLASRGISEQAVGVVQEDKVLAYWQPLTGEAEIYPQLEQLKTEAFEPANNTHLAAANSLAREVFARPDILPKDETKYTLGEARPLVGATVQKGANGGKAAASAQMLYLTYVPVQRQVQGYPVHGPGSRALLAVDNENNIQSFVLHWKAGSAGGTAREERNAEQVYAALKAAVAPLAKSGDVQVLSAGIVYYDDEGDQMGPAYRLTARVHAAVPAGQKSQHMADDDFVVLYAPYGNAALPASLTASGGAQPETAIQAMRKVVPVKAVVPPGDPTVGRYVVRNDDPGWVNDANAFWSGLTSNGGGSLFTNSQYYWAQPWEFTSNAAQFIDSVQVGETEAHGDWWYFTTYQDWGDGVNIDAIQASGGYGQANHGSLNYWVLHGCEIVPSAMDAPCPAGSPNTDTRNWYDTWFRVFQGLHTVVGYRTIMYINDGVGGPFATSLRQGSPVISSWFNATLSNSDYQSPDPTYKAHCGLNLPMGRPSAVTVCGHSNDNIYNQSAIPAPSCLTNFWWPN
jgi:hypothetical protein